MLRIGIWFDTRHCSYGGPTLVLLGTLIGLIQDSVTTDRPVMILINENGDVNWVLQNILDYDCVQNPIIGPLSLSHGDSLCQDYSQHPLWNLSRQFIVPSTWFRNLVCRGLPFDDPAQAGSRKLTVWGSGVDTDFFQPGEKKKTNDFFIYFKSQKYMYLNKLNVYLFNNYFKLAGNTVTYYHYTPQMLKDECHTSGFCFFMSTTETQGLAALEIMACDVPLFVLDVTVYTIEHIEAPSTSVTCWDDRCGMKSTWETLETDFPIFFENVQKGLYRPREFVLEKYSFQKAAHELRTIFDNHLSNL